MCSEKWPVFAASGPQKFTPTNGQRGGCLRWGSIVGVAFIAILLVLAIIGSFMDGDEKVERDSAQADQEQTDSASGISETAVSAAEPPTADDVSENAVYAAAMAPVLDEWATLMSDMSAHLTETGSDPSIVFLDSWQSDLLGMLDETRGIGEEISQIPVPPSMVPASLEIDSALEALDGVDSELRAALVEINAGRIESAILHVEAATNEMTAMGDHLTEATDLLPQ